MKVRREDGGGNEGVCGRGLSVWAERRDKLAQCTDVGGVSGSSKRNRGLKLQVRQELVRE